VRKNTRTMSNGKFILTRLFMSLFPLFIIII
jgi:hypothetical protein